QIDFSDVFWTSRRASFAVGKPGRRPIRAVPPWAQEGQKPLMKPLTPTNDFVVKFAKVNGLGSATAKRLFATDMLRNGVPVSARNVFPPESRVGPTWCGGRVCGDGGRGRRGGLDLGVAMNPKTGEADVKEITPGGYLLYDSSKPLPASKFRDDITIIGAP